MDSSSDKQVFVSFNHDNSSLLVGDNTGYRVYDTPTSSNVNLKLICENVDFKFISIIQWDLKSDILALTTVNKPKMLRICYLQERRQFSELSYESEILAFKFTKQFMVVCLERCIWIHSALEDFKVVHRIKNIPANVAGLMALSYAHNLLAYPSKNLSGEVALFDLANRKYLKAISAHLNPLAAMEFDPTGTKLATASEWGTVIRVFDVAAGECLHEYRRGLVRCATIYSLAFSADSSLLAVSSSTETVHIFKLPVNSKAQSSWTSYLASALQSTGYLNPLAEVMITQDRSFATAKLPISESAKSVCAIKITDATAHILVASSDGYLFVFEMNLEDGGECSLVKQFKLFDDPLK